MTSSEINDKLRGYAVAHKAMKNYYSSTHTDCLYEAVDYLYRLMAFVKEDLKIYDFFQKTNEIDRLARDLEEKIYNLMNELMVEIVRQGGDYNKLLEQEDSLRRQGDEKAHT